MRYPRIIAHRCGGALAPENTLAGLRIASRLGCRGVEFDAMLSGDGIPVLVHDDTLERTTTLAGPVAARTEVELGNADAGAKHHAAFSGESLPTLRRALEVCAHLGLWANVEIKPSAGADTATGYAVATISEPFDDVLLSSFSLEALEVAGKAAPRLPRALLIESVARDPFSLAEELGVQALHMPCGLATADGIGKLHGAGLGVAIFTVNHRPLAEQMFAWGVDAVFTDRPDLWLPEEM